MLLPDGHVHSPMAVSGPILQLEPTVNEAPVWAVVPTLNAVHPTEEHVQLGLGVRATG